VTGAATPVPESEIVRGLEFVVLKSLIVPVCSPADVGMNTTCMLTYPPFGWSVMGSPCPFWNDGTNCAEAVSELMVRALPPEFTNEKTKGALAVLTVWAGVKLKLEGDACSFAPVVA
jgi:hypothetical protein